MNGPGLAMSAPAAPSRLGPTPAWQVEAGHIVVGPITGPGLAPCDACVDARLRSHGWGARRPPDASAEGLVAVGRDLLNREGAPQGVALEWRDGRWRRHLVLPHPECSCCVALAPGACSLEQAISSLFGIVGALEQSPAPGLEIDVPWTLSVARACGLPALGGLATNIDGAGFGPAQPSATAAIGEAVERYAASFIAPDLPVCAAADLGAEHLTPENAHFGGAALDAGHPLRWALGRRLIDDSPCWVQASAVYFPYVCHDLEPRRSWGGSEGLAAGASWEAAVTHAVYERLERDAFIRAWRFNGPRRALPDPYAELSELRFVQVGNRFGVPVVVCFAEAAAPPYAVAGIAARADLASAVEACAREALGARAMYDRTRDQRGSRVEARNHHAHAPELRAVREAWRSSGPPMAEPVTDLSWRDLVQRLPDAVAVDVTTPDVRALGVHVARVVIPGCRGSEPVFGTSRLGGAAAPSPF